MRKRFWGSMIICLFATFYILTFVAISSHKKQDRDGPVFASAKITGISKLKARGVVEATKVCVIGAWGIYTRSGNKRGPNDGNGVSYRNGVNKSSEIAQYTSSASASSWISGYNRHGDSYYACASDSKRTDN